MPEPGIPMVHALGKCCTMESNLIYISVVIAIKLMLLNFADLTVLELPGFGFVLCICLFVFLPNMPHLRMGDSLDVL